MKYKARQIVLVRKIRKQTGIDLRELNFQDKLSGIISEKVPFNQSDSEVICYKEQFPDI